MFYSPVLCPGDICSSVSLDQLSGVHIQCCLGPGWVGSGLGYHRVLASRQPYWDQLLPLVDNVQDL